MLINIDRDIMRWFDIFFEEGKNKVDINSFVCVLEGRGIVLRKNNTDYWVLKFFISDNHINKLINNVHPRFNEYIFKEISLYKDDMIYDFLNRYIQIIFENIVSYSYDEDERSYYVDYKDSFVDKYQRMNLGDVKKIDEDLYISPITKDMVDFSNQDGSFNLKLRYNTSLGEDLMDSLLNLRKSILINI